MTNTSSLLSLKGVGPKVLEKLHRLKLFELEDLLFHLPLRYEDRTSIQKIRGLRVGMRVQIEGKVLHQETIRKRATRLIVRLEDDTGKIDLVFFHFSEAQKKFLLPGQTLRCYGEVRFGAQGLEISHPEYQNIGSTPPPLPTTLTPIYPSTEGLAQTLLRKCILQASTLLKEKNLPELLPPEILEHYHFSDLKTSLEYLHSPPKSAHLLPHQKRLSFEELLAHHLSLRKLRLQARNHTAPRFTEQANLIHQLLETLPFQLTAAQKRAFADIQADLAQAQPMLRLVQGDVGSGKTIVAALAALLAIQNGYQACLMAPTELLAEQHFQSLSRYLNPLGISLGLLTAQSKGRARQTILEQIQNHEAQFIVGTHALFQEAVQFKKLGLVIIDEQHRFGVHQRFALKNKGLAPHQLMMTATPIPRTLAMTAYADLDQSIMDELPPGRKPITTVAIDQQRRAEVIERIRHVCASGAQVYWVCTLIEESEVLQCQAAEHAAQLLSTQLPELKVALIHGRLKSSEKDAMMSAFAKQEADILVATTVIEVGVDVPNASLMVIENPERLGLAQLHQLRGRVGRGERASHCVLLYQSPLSHHAKERLQILRESQNGFVIAEKDLELRGPGEVLGTKQTGEIDLKVADLLRDKDLLPAIHELAPTLQQDHPELCELIIQRWLGHKQHYRET